MIILNEADNFKFCWLDNSVINFTVFLTLNISVYPDHSYTHIDSEKKKKKKSHSKQHNCVFSDCTCIFSSPESSNHEINILQPPILFGKSRAATHDPRFYSISLVHQSGEAVETSDQGKPQNGLQRTLV